MMKILSYRLVLYGLIENLIVNENLQKIKGDRDTKIREKYKFIIYLKGYTSNNTIIVVVK